MKVLTAPGVTWGETDVSEYSTSYGPTTAYIMGFTEKGEAYQPMEFTSRTAWSNYYGYPRNEAEKYSYAAVTECLDQGGHLVFARLPYDNPSFKKVAAFKYTVNSKPNQIQYVVNSEGEADQTSSTQFYEIQAVDSSIKNVSIIKSTDCPYLFDLDTIDAYRTGETKPASDTFVIADIAFNQYGKIDDDVRKNEKCEFIGIMPVVTTAANAMFAQQLIDVDPQNVVGYETIGCVRTINAANQLKDEYPSLSSLIANQMKDSDSAQLLNTKGWYQFVATQSIRVTMTLAVNDAEDSEALPAEISAAITENAGLADTWNGEYQIVDSTHVSVSFKKVFRSSEYESETSTTDKKYQTLQDWIAEDEGNRESYKSYIQLFGWHNPDGDDAVPATLSQNANDYFPTINFNGDKFEREHLKKIGIVVYKMYLDPSEGNKINYEPVEAFAGSLCRTDKDPTTGATTFIDDIVNSQSEYINVFSNCFSTPAAKKRYMNTIDMLVMQPDSNSTSDQAEQLIINFMNDFKDAIDKLAERAGISLKTVYVGNITQNFVQLNDLFTDEVLDAAELDKDTINKLKERFEELCDLVGLRIANEVVVPSLGFYADMTEQDISISKSIYDGMTKCFENVKNINDYEIDIVPDAGLANIASYLRALFGDKGKYDLYITDDAGNSLLGMWKATSNNNAVKTWKAVEQKLDSFCKNTRADCMFIADGLRPTVLQGQKPIVRSSKPENTIDANIIPYLKYMQGLNTSYGACYVNWFQKADEYSGDLFWCPPSILAMGAYLFTDTNYNFWDAPAGLTRGVMSAVDLSFNPSPDQAGYFYEKNFNYAINYPNDGIILEGQKTLQTKSTAFDRVNVRRLFLKLERQCYKVARYFVYEGNTAYNRQRLVDALDPYFKDIKNATDQGIYDYKIICDETINTEETIDRHELHVKIGIKPTKTIEFIYVEFVCGRTGSSWSEMGF